MRKLTKTMIVTVAAGLFCAADSYASPTPQAGAQQAAPAPAATPSPAQKAPAAKSTISTAAKPKTAVPFSLKTPKDKNSYAVGMNMGKGLASSLKTQSVDLDQAILIRGFKDALAGGKTLLTDDEVKTILTQLQTDLRTQQMAKAKEDTDTNKKAGAEYLASNKTKEGVVTLPSGLQYKILAEGTGPKPTAADTVTANYRGTLLNGTEFDSSAKHGQPGTFPVTGVIKGWTEALQLMPVGSKWQLFIPSDLAYGDRGADPRSGIGPGATLIFEVELLSIQPKNVPDATTKQP